MSLRNNIINNGPYPIFLKSAIIQIIQALFSDSSIIRDGDLSDEVWTSNRKTNEILIGSVERFDLTQMEKRPAVLVKRSQTKFIDLTQKDNRVEIGEDGDGNRIEYREFRVSSNFEVRCIAKTSAEAELLASEVSIRLKEITKVITDDYFLRRFKVGGIGASNFQKQTDDWVVVIPIKIDAHHSSKINISDLPDRLADPDWRKKEN